MSDVINLTARRTLRSGDAFISEIGKRAGNEIANILAADITNLNGTELRKLRDSLISLQVMQALSVAKTRGLIAQRVKELSRDLTPEEALECAGPIRAIKFSLA
jgi:hypothetical protein